MKSTSYRRRNTAESNVGRYTKMPLDRVIGPACELRSRCAHFSLATMHRLPVDRDPGWRVSTGRFGFDFGGFTIARVIVASWWWRRVFVLELDAPLSRLFSSVCVMSEMPCRRVVASGDAL